MQACGRFLRRLALCAVAVIVFVRGASAAPMFPDVPDMWAKDAVAALAAKGLLEGYPDGTFKGDRAATRYEVAMIVARLLARMESENATFASKSDLETLRALALSLRDQLDDLGLKIDGAEEELARLNRRVDDLQRIRFEGDMTTTYGSIGMRNTGKGGTAWGSDVGNVGGLNFNRGHKFGVIDMLNGRPFLNGEGLSMRARLGVKIKLDPDTDAAMRFAAYTSMGNPYIDAYWGVPAPYVTNPFAANGPAGLPGALAGGAGAVLPSPDGSNNQPWTRAVFDKFVLEHKPSHIRFTSGAIEETLMDPFVLQRVPNPNVHGKSMADFSETVVSGRKQSDVVTLRYREDEETYLPFWGVQAAGKADLLGEMLWEGMWSKLPFGANPTAGPLQPPTNDATQPFFYSGNLTWKLGDQGAVKLAYLSVRDEPTNGGPLPNVGNYFFWTDPASYAGLPRGDQPMRGNSFVSNQTQWGGGAAVHYRFEPSGIRTVFEYGLTRYKPNSDSAYTASGAFWRVGAGYTNPSNTLRLDAEFISTNPYYDPYQLYFQPLGNLALGGVPPGTPLAFAVVPLYYGGFPGAYVPFGYQLHDSGLYPNNRDGMRFSGEYMFPKGAGNVELRLARFVQDQPSTPHLDITGRIHGMPVGFIDTVFNPLMTDGRTVMEQPRGSETNLGGSFNYRLTPKVGLHAQYDDFRFLRSTNFAPDTDTARKNYVNLVYDVAKLGLDYALSNKMLLRGGWNLVSVHGYHPALNAATYNPFTNTFVGVNAGTTLVSLTQQSPYLGFELKLSDTVKWTMEGRYIINSDHLVDAVSPESFSGTQITSEFSVKF